MSSDGLPLDLTVRRVDGGEAHGYVISILARTCEQMGHEWANATAATAAGKIDQPHEPAVLIEPLEGFHWWRWYVKDV
jgi:hypothetical protein